jgi:arabinogalactan endo-1,4-beta-galactosidase
MKLLTIACLAAFAAAGCSKMTSLSPAAGSPATATTVKTTDATTQATSGSTFAYGSDVSWYTQMAASGYNFYNNSGVEQSVYTILAGKGINAIRLRVWVNPSGGWCGTSDVVAKAVAAQAAGMAIMIDFHYSDTWADPGTQTVPVAWASLTFDELMTEVYNYTESVLTTLKSNGVTPTWVQVGNETNNGMLWPDGEASINMENYAWLVNCGYNATKAIFPNCKVIVHLANGYNTTDFEWLFDGLKEYGASWDVIGMSLYPTASNYATLDAECLSNMQTMVSRYGKQVMICEVGFAENDPTDAEAFLKDIIAKTQSVSGGLGVFYWEPECYDNWQGYGSGAFGSNGEPTAALNAF